MTSSDHRHLLPLERVASDAEVATAFSVAARVTLGQLAAAPGRPAAMAPFDSLLGESWRLDELRRAGRPIVGVLCNFAPEELILALGAVPLRLDLGQSDAARAGGRVLPADVCPAIKCIVGAELAQLPYYREAQLLVVPTACDGKKKLARVLGDSREVFVLELPVRKGGPRSPAAWVEQVRALADRLQRLTGRSLRRGALREAIELLNRRTAVARRLNELRWQRPGALSGADALLVFQATFVADPAWWVEKAEALLRELEARPAATGDRRVRLLLTGSPVLFPDFRLLQIVEAAGATIVADETCAGTERLHHPVVVDEWTTPAMLRAVADKALLPCTCPCFVSSDDRIDRLLELARVSGAQGVLHHTLRLCQLYDLELPAVSAAARQRELPLLNIYTEHGAEDAAVIQNRVEAFVEMLQQ
jgi:benzoyl-CoA reductase/2-hydroxyglutaryl-CoA dehydratase subunit BcrC/BadD/HgdB